MKRSMLLFCLLLLCFKLMAPAGMASLSIVRSKAIYPYEKLWEAICEVESGGDCYAIGDKDLSHHSYGIAQIRQSRLDDYAKRTGRVYTVQDCFDKEISKEIFMFYVTQDMERTAREWNGGARGMSKKSTLKYWEKVRRLM